MHEERSSVYQNISDVNRAAMALTWYLPPSRFKHRSLYDFRLPCTPYTLYYLRFPLSYTSLSLSFSPFFCLSSLFLSVYIRSYLFEHTSTLALFRTSTTCRYVYTIWERRRRRGLCTIVVSRLLFPGNSTSFTNYPLRARIVRKWRSSPTLPTNVVPVEKGDDDPKNGDDAGSYLAIV